MNGPYSQSVADWACVRIEDSAGAGITGIAWNAAGLAFKLAKSGLAAATKTLSSASDWVEQANGYYWVALTSGDLDTVGPCMLIVIYNGTELAVPFRVYVNDLDQIGTRTQNIKTKTDTLPATPADEATLLAVKAKTDNLPANPASQTNLDVAVSTRLAAASYTAPDNATVAAIKAATDRLLGLVHDNAVMDQQVYDGDGRLTGARLRCYNSKANADAAGATGLLFTYLITATYGGGGELTSYKVTRDA